VPPRDRPPLAVLGRGPAPVPAPPSTRNDLARLLATAERDRELAAELLGMPPLERIAAAGAEPRFWRPSLVRLLVLAVEAALEDPAEDPRPAAELAAALAAAVPTDPAGKADRAAAWAWWLQGKALLRAGQWRLAKSTFESMSAFIPPEPWPSEEAALAAAGLGQAWEDAGEVDAAEGQLLYAAYLYGKLDADRPCASCYAQAGFVRYEHGERAWAAPALRMAIDLLDDPACAPSLAARVWLTLAEIAAAAGDATAAGEHMERARTLYPLVRAAGEELDRAWRLARIARAAGDPGRAEALLDPVRRELLARSSLDEAARATFELTLLRIEAGHLVAAFEPGRALARAFPGAAGLAAEMAALPRLAPRSPEALAGATRELGRRLRQEPPLLPGRLPLLRPTRQLADRLLRQRGELEDAIGCAPPGT
jgi:tetratricopeptide (TPR) repeat protein